MYHHGASPTSDEHNFGELTTDAAGVAGVADDEVTRVYHHSDFRHAGNDNNVGELYTDAAGVADDDDTGVYHHGDFRDAGYEDNVGEPNPHATGVAEDDDTGVYHHGDFRDAGYEDTVGEPNPDATGVADDEVTRVYNHQAFRDADDEDNDGELNADAAGVADDGDTRVNDHQAVYDAGLQHRLGELGTDVSGVDEDKAVWIHDRQAYPNASDEPMGDAPNYFLDSSRDDSSDLTSCSTGSRSPNIIAEAIGSFEAYAGMELLDQTFGEPKIISSDVKDVIMGEAEKGTVDGAEDRPGETAQSIWYHTSWPYSRIRSHSIT